MPTARQQQAIYTDGTSQEQRWQSKLSPSHALVDERSFEQLVEASRCLAPQIAFYNNQDQLEGDWESFVPTAAELKSLIAQAELDQNLSPHLALFVAFLRLFQYAQDDLNRFTQRHLDFYYEQILQFEYLPPAPDQVHVLFELARQTARSKIEKGSLLKAGKDTNGKSLFYELGEELMVNQNKVSSIKSVFADPRWGNRIFEAGVANSLDGKGKPLTEEQASWATFGESQLGRTEEEQSMQASEVGFAISSPVLKMQEGVRKGNLQLTFSNPHGLTPKQLNDSFAVYLSAEQEWVKARNIQILTTTDNKVIEVKWRLNQDDPPIVPFEEAFEDSKVHSPHPIAKFVLNHKAQSYLFNEFKDNALQLERLRLEVSVEGLVNALLSNDDAALNPNKSFYPLSALPSIGSNFFIGCEELKGKTLNALSLNVQWDDLPLGANGFSDHYAAYSGARSNSAFKADVHVFSNNQWTGSGDVQLFTPTSGALNRNIFPISIYNGGFRVSDAQKVARLGLKGVDFGHTEYPNRYSSVAIAIAGGASQNLPNQPYSPKIKSFSLDYTASLNITFTSSQKQSQFHHIEAFGSYVAGRTSKPTLVPPLANGTIYIGLENSNPPQNLSLLAQCVEGSANADAALVSSDIQWSYLVDDVWYPFESKAVLSDASLGFQKAGIIRLALTKLGNHADRMPSNLNWIKAETNGDPTGAARLLQLSAQAAKASLVDVEQHLEHLLQPLEATRISRLLERNRNIKKIAQPFPSFAGQAQESQQSFYRRVSERLRHKQRAITCWDYEHIILQAFPELYKVKCLTHTGKTCNCGCGCEEIPDEATGGCGSENANGKETARSGNQSKDCECGGSSNCRANDCRAGDVSLVVIPRTDTAYTSDPFQPKASPVLRERITAYLQKLIPSLFVKVHVLNPCYEPIVVKCKVAFHEEYDAGYYLDVLNEGLKKLLAPWAFSEGEDIAIGGQVFASSIIKFIENQVYVDYLRDFQLKHFPCYPGIGEMCITDEENEYLDDFTVRPLKSSPIVASSPTSVLVSAYEHELSLVDENCVCQVSELPECGIGKMSIEQNFKIK